MSIVSLLEKSEADTSVQPIYDKAEDHFGHVPNLVKALAHNPVLCKSITEFLIQSLGEGRVNWPFKELVILKTLEVMNSEYGVSGHRDLAIKLGLTQDKLNGIAGDTWKDHADFSDAEKAVFKLITQIGVDANDVGPSYWDELKAHWDDGQLLELTSVITTFLAIGRVGDSLRVSDPILFTRSFSMN